MTQLQTMTNEMIIPDKVNKHGKQEGRLKTEFSRSPEKVVMAEDRELFIFHIDGNNIDKQVVNDFGEEWLRFHDFSDDVISESVSEYFDILDAGLISKQTYVLDIGCGTGRWTKYIARKAGFVEAVDPSKSIFAAAKLLKETPNVRLTKASVETLPFEDNTFDFAMSIGVLHHIPDTQQALKDCVRKVKPGGHFYLYVYYNLEGKGIFFKIIYQVATLIRKVISRFPLPIKRLACDLIAVVAYMPLILLTRLLRKVGLKKLAALLPLNSYHNKSFYMIRNDALDRFETRLEHRFSQEAIGLTEKLLK